MSRHRIALPLAVALTAVALGAQSQTELLADFDRLWREWNTRGDVAADAGELVPRACDAFLRLAPGPARDERLPAGAALALAAGRNELALELATGGELPELVTVRLRALARLGRFDAFVDGLLEVLPAAPAAARAALESEEGRLLPMAAEALRREDPTPGKFVFQMLARLEPVQSYRIANAALCLRQLGDVDAALAMYERGRELAPDDLQLLNDQGLLLRGIGRHDEAIATFRRAVALDLERPEPMKGRGPAITNLMLSECLQPGSAGDDPLPIAVDALRRRPDARLLRRLTLDVQLDRLEQRRPPVAGAPDRR